MSRVSCTTMVLISGVLTSCSNGEDSAGTFTVVDSAGVKVVQYQTGDIQQAGRIRLSRTPSLEIGSVDDEATMLYNVTDAARVMDGAIAIANSGTGEIRLYDPSGGLLHSLGGLGAGPGEFRRLAAIDTSSDGRLLAYDGDLGRVYAFDLTSGALIETVNLELSPGLYSLGGLRRALPIGWFQDGTFVGYYEVLLGEAVSNRDGWERRQYMAHIHFFDDGESGKSRVSSRGRQSMVRTSWTGDGRVRMGGFRIPFLPSLAVATDGEHVAFGNTQDYEIRVLDRSGTLVRIVRRVQEPSLLSEDLRQAWISSELADVEVGSELVARRSEYEQIPLSDTDTVPAFESLLVQEGGRLWIKEATPLEQWSVIDLGGGPLGAVGMPMGFRPTEIGTDYVLGVWTDALGVEYVQLYDLVVARGG